MIELEKRRRVERAADDTEHGAEEVMQVAEPVAFGRLLCVGAEHRLRRVPVLMRERGLLREQHRDDQQYAAEVGQHARDSTYIDLRCGGEPLIAVDRRLLLDAYGRPARAALCPLPCFHPGIHGRRAARRGGLRHHPGGVPPGAGACDRSDRRDDCPRAGISAVSRPGEVRACAPDVGALSAFALAGHSFMDGVGIGLGFQVSNTVGVTVAMAVIAHDFCDGLNTVSLMLVHRNTKRRSLAMLVLDAAAPVIGAASTLLFQAPPAFSVVYLGFFAGFLLYIGAADILPEAHSRAAPRTAIVLMAFTTLGAALMFVATRLAG
ncbi:MAG: hypothetical protein E6H63_04670 [Betaproteobacteria bacterium]|nr:MAG: hypothetical protein E6H63_04670 [Betaproteobacteria bacterium]